MKQIQPGDVVRITDRPWWGDAVVVRHDGRVDRWVIAFEKSNMYTHSCEGQVDGHRGYWVKAEDISIVRRGEGDGERILGCGDMPCAGNM